LFKFNFFISLFKKEFLAQKNSKKTKHENLSLYYYFVVLISIFIKKFLALISSKKIRLMFNVYIKNNIKMAKGQSMILMNSKNVGKKEPKLQGFFDKYVASINFQQKKLYNRSTK